MHIRLPLDDETMYSLHGFRADHRFWGMEFKGQDLEQIEIPNDLRHVMLMSGMIPKPYRIETKSINEMLSTYPMPSDSTKRP